MSTTSAGSVPSLSPTRATYAGLFLVTLSTLMYEIVLTRIFSVTMWYHFAFVAISIALFGLTAGALLVHLVPKWFPNASVRTQLWGFSLAFAVSIGISIVIQLLIPVDPTLTWNGVVTVLGTCLAVAVPFVLSGIVVCLALTRFPGRVNRLYAADLVGGGLGCILLVFLLSKLDAPSVVVLVGAFAGLGALTFATDVGRRRAIVASALAVVVLGGFAITNSRLQLDGDAPLRIRYAKGVEDHEHLYEKWNTHSRVTVDGIADLDFPPFGWGMSSTLPPELTVNALGITIDSIAGTPMTRYTGDSNETDFLRYDISNLAQWVRDDAEIAVVGVGGGRDILSALEFEQRSVVGIELNKTMLEIAHDRYGDFTGQLDDNPKVTLVNDEARSYLARTDEKFDIIQMSMTDTSAAGSAGAYALGENSVYTVEAWDLFLDRLKPDGVLSVTRWFTINGRPPLETYRAAVLAAEVLAERGVERPRDHILIYKSPIAGYSSDVATILVSATAFSADDLAAIDEQVTRLAFDPVLTPSEAIDERFEAIVDPDGTDGALDLFTEDVSAPTDNRPFFFQMANLGTILEGEGFGNNDTTVPVLQPVAVLTLLGGIVLALAALCIGLPLVFDRPRRTRRSGMAPLTLYFGGIGLAFLFIEIAQLERLSVYLGQPVYALAVVLCSVLIFSGIGSFLVERFIDPTRPRSLLVPLGVLVVLGVIFGIATPEVIAGTDGATTPARIAISVGLLAPMALVMGMPFTIGMRAAGLVSSETPTAFLWGVNGATSVCASVLALVFSIFFGISVAFWIGTVAYAVAFLALLAVVRRLRRGDAAAETASATAQPAPPAPAEPVPAG